MKKKSALMCSGAFLIGLLATANPVNAQPLQKGIQSEQVVDLQQRLQSLGYFKVGITGYYGSITTSSVRKYQQEHNLSATGDADDATLTILQKAVPSNSMAIEQMARIIHSEARGESFQGQVAVGAVVLNRVQASQFPDSISDVIFQTGQFSAIGDGQYTLNPDASAYQAARAALNGVDPTNGALFYHNPKIATSAWSLSRPAIVTIGNHVFTR
jgi:N-acetylmuramoyl-L-alanine amidase